jgi:hypothetical protein
MNDLLTSLHEASEERLAIAGESEDVRAEIHRCEVNTLVNRYFPHGGEQLGEFLKLVESKRGKPAADQLRADCREEWKKRK